MVKVDISIDKRKGAIILKLIIVTANEVIQTGKISFIFLFDSKLEYSKHQEMGGGYGFIWDNEDKSVGINVFQDGRGMVFGWGHEEFSKDWIADLLEKMDPATLLMSKDKAEMMKKYCDENNIEYHYHHYDGVLRSA